MRTTTHTLKQHSKQFGYGNIQFLLRQLNVALFFSQGRYIIYIIYMYILHIYVYFFYVYMYVHIHIRIFNIGILEVGVYPNSTTLLLDKLNVEMY